MVVVDTLQAMNEFTASVSASVDAFVLSNGDELFRALAVGSNWNKLRLSFRYTLIGTPVTGSITGVRFFAGICAGYDKRLDQPDDHAAGFMIADFPDGDATSLVGVTHVSASIPSASVAFSNTSFFVGREVEGVFGGTAGKANAVFPRYETQWSSSYSYYRLMNYPWAEACVSIRRFPPSSGSLSWSAFGGTQYPFNNSLGEYVINKPRSIFLSATEVENDGGGGGGSGMLDWGNLLLNFFRDEVVINQTYEGNSTDAMVFDEATYGYFDSVNFKFQCTTPGVKLAIRDIVVTLLEPAI